MRPFLFVALLLMMVLAPLPLGSNRPFFWSLTTLSTGVLFILWGGNVFARQKRSTTVPLLYGAIFFFFITIFWAAIQQAAFVPEVWWHPLWKEASLTLGVEPLAGAISINAHRSGTALMRLLSYGALFWLSLKLCKTPDRSFALIKSVAIAGLLYSCYGLAVYFSGNDTILWLNKWAYPDDLVGTFVNRNSFASYAGITLVCSTAILVKTTLEDMASATTAKTVTREFLRSITTKGSIWLVAFFIILTAIYLSHSRAGLFCSLTGLGIFIITFTMSRAFRPAYGVLIGVVIASVAVGVFFVSGETTMKRVDQADDSAQSRARLFGVSLKAIKERPYLGAGYGVYEEIIPAFADDKNYHYMRAAHNTYLENAVELGVFGVGSLLVSIGMLVVICIKGALKKCADPIYPCIGLGITVIVGVHSLVDFPLQIPAVALTYAAVMGASCAQSLRFVAKREFSVEAKRSARMRRVDYMPKKRF